MKGGDHVAVFHPLTLRLPSWHPNGPDAELDGYVIPFVVPAGGPQTSDNRDARIAVNSTDAEGWTAYTQSFTDCAAYTGDQARAIAAAWIRAAEVLDNARTKPRDVEDQDDNVIDAELADVDDDGIPL